MAIIRGSTVTKFPSLLPRECDLKWDGAGGIFPLERWGRRFGGVDCMEIAGEFLARLWNHWWALLGVLLVVEPVIDYSWAGYQKWADKYVFRKARTTVALAFSAAALLLASFLAFGDQYHATKVITADRDHQAGRVEYWRSVSDGLHRSIDDPDGYKAQINGLQAQLAAGHNTGRKTPPVSIPGSGNAVSFGQQGGLTAGTVNLGKPDRILTEDKGAELLKLIPSGTKKITITATMSDAEAYRLGDQIKRFLVAKGYGVEGVNQGVFMPPVEGVGVNTRDPANVQISIGGQ
jgi:hypothetical protein